MIAVAAAARASARQEPANAAAEAEHDERVEQTTAQSAASKIGPRKSCGSLLR